MFQVIALAILITALVIIIFALLVIIAFSYLAVKMLETQFRGYDTALPNTTITEGDKDQISKEYGLPLDQFSPDFQKPIKIIYKETPQGIEETEEGL